MENNASILLNVLYGLRDAAQDCGHPGFSEDLNAVALKYSYLDGRSNVTFLDHRNIPGRAELLNRLTNTVSDDQAG